MNTNPSPAVILTHRAQVERVFRHCPLPAVRHVGAVLCDAIQAYGWPGQDVMINGRRYWPDLEQERQNFRQLPSEEHLQLRGAGLFLTLFLAALVNVRLPLRVV